MRFPSIRQILALVLVVIVVVNLFLMATGNLPLWGFWVILVVAFLITWIFYYQPQQ